MVAMMLPANTSLEEILGSADFSAFAGAGSFLGSLSSRALAETKYHPRRDARQQAHTSKMLRASS